MTSRLRDATWLGVRSGGTGRPTGHDHHHEHPHGGTDHHGHDHAGDDHGHEHGHEHGGYHAHEDAGEAAQELGTSPLLDIGGDVGAMVVYLAGPTRSGELEARPARRPGNKFHTGVHLREVGGDEQWLAVFPEARAGEYELLDDDGEPIAPVHVTGGQVSEVDLRRR
jgi:hypothetical protein